MGLPHIEWEALSGLKIYFILNKMALGAIVGDDPDFGSDFSLRGRLDLESFLSTR